MNRWVNDDTYKWANDDEMVMIYTIILWWYLQWDGNDIYIQWEYNEVMIIFTDEIYLQWGTDDIYNEALILYEMKWEMIIIYIH